MTNSGSNSYIEYLLTQITKWMSNGIITVSLIIMIIWIIDPTLIITMMPQSETLKFNTALLFMLCTISMMTINQTQTQLRRWYRYIPIIIIVVAGTTLMAALSSSTLFLDELIVSDPLTPLDAFPGQMSAATSFLFLLMGIAILVKAYSTTIAEQIAVFVNLTGLVVILAFLFDFNSLYLITFFNTISFFTGLLFVLTSSIFILSLQDGIIYNLVKENNPSGFTARRLIPTILLVPTLLGWIILQGANAGLYQPIFALVLMIIATISLQLTMTIMHTVALRRWNRKNEQMVRELHKHEIEHIELQNMREINKLKEEFLAQLSHDMRTPISRIILSGDIILQYYDRLSQDQRANHMKKIRYQALGMLDFVDDLVLLSQLDLDGLPYEPMPNNIVQFCRDYHEEFIEYNDHEVHHFTFEASDSGIELEFDPKLMRRMLNNLVSNAIKYSPEGGNIVLSVIRRDTQIELCVSDEGIGIPEESIEHLYDLFARANNVNHISGYGLGLAIVKKVTDTHQATISVDSTIGQGTTFCVRFKTS